MLDVGCGPGRFAAALSARGVPGLGIDVSPARSRTPARRGAPCAAPCRRGGHLPAEGRWGTVLLADGNIGIGGDPRALLERCRALVGPHGLLLVEADPDQDADDTSPLTLRVPTVGRAGPMPWARIGVPRSPGSRPAAVSPSGAVAPAAGGPSSRCGRSETSVRRRPHGAAGRGPQGRFPGRPRHVPTAAPTSTARARTAAATTRESSAARAPRTGHGGCGTPRR